MHSTLLSFDGLGELTERPIDFDVLPLRVQLIDGRAILHVQNKDEENNCKVERLTLNRKIRPMSLGCKGFDED